jgi:4-hydroxy 2-oxovalerate aldolase
MFPHQIEGFFRPLLELKHIRWGFHPHNNLQMAFANSLAAVEAGAQVIDSSVYGMGRGAGNLPTEILLAYLQLANPERYNVIPVLSLVDHYFEKLKQEYGWGYDLPYMLSGIYGCHPDYAKNLVDRKEYNIEEIWNILGIVRNYDPIGYKKPLVDDILKKGVFGRKYTSLGNNQSVILNSGFRRKVNYIDRHSGRGFLVIANGPSLPKHVEAISQFIDKYQPIVMAGNYIGDLFKPDYHAFNNKRRFVDYVGLVAKESALLIGEYISDEMIIEYTDRDFERMYYEDVQDAPFDINEGVISSNCRTIALLLMGTAIIMGAERIFAVGLDGYLNQQDGEFLHFYNEKDESTDSATLMDKHLGNLKFLDEIDQYLIRHGKEGVHILTPTNYTKFYKGIENYL